MNDAVLKGLILDVYRTDALGDCTNGGISAKVNQVTIVGVINFEGREEVASLLPGDCRVFAPSDKAPAVMLVKRNVWPGERPHTYLVPIYPGENARAFIGRNMMGGNYAATSDSRLREVAGHSYPIPIHDRREV